MASVESDVSVSFNPSVAPGGELGYSKKRGKTPMLMHSKFDCGAQKMSD